MFKHGAGTHSDLVHRSPPRRTATISLGDSPFWTLHLDTLVTSVVLGVIAFGFLWLVVRGATAGVPGKRQAFVELAVSFVDDQVKGIFHGDRALRDAARAHGVRVGAPHERDGLPARGHHGVDLRARVPPAQLAPGADRRREHDVRARALGVGADDLLQHQGERPRRLDPRALLRAVRLEPAAVARQLPLQPGRVHLEAAVALAAALRKHVRRRDHLPAAVAVGRDRAWSAPSSARCSASAGRSSTS